MRNIPMCNIVFCRKQFCVVLIKGCFQDSYSQIVRERPESCPIVPASAGENTLPVIHNEGTSLLYRISVFDIPDTKSEPYVPSLQQVKPTKYRQKIYSPVHNKCPASRQSIWRFARSYATEICNNSWPPWLLFYQKNTEIARTPNWLSVNRDIRPYTHLMDFQK